MTERTKRPKSKVTWSDVKSKLADFDRAGLQQLVANLYVFHKDNQTFLHARFGLGENPLEAYKQRIQAALAPDISRKRNANISVAAANQLPFATPQKLTFERLQYSVTCRWVESHYSA